MRPAPNFPTPTSSRRISVQPSGLHQSRTPGNLNGRAAMPMDALSSARRSSFFKPISTKDPRPFNDPGFKAQMVSKIHTFLVEQCGMSDIPERIIRSPSNRDFITIFECIYQHYDSNFRITGKIEDEVPTIFVRLGYPYVLKGSSLKTVGASHAWSQIFGALVWLVDHVMLSERVTAQDILLGSRTTETATKATLKYLFKQNIFRSAVDNDMRIDDNFMKSHTHRLRVQLRDGVLQGVQTNELKEQIDLLQQEIKIIKEEGNNDLEKALKGDILALQGDVRSQRSYLMELQAQKAAQEHKLNEVKKDLELCEDGLAKVQQKVLDNEKRIEAQATQFGLQPDAARNVKGENISLRQEIQKFQAELDEIGKKKWKERPALREKLDNLKTLLRQWYREVLEVKMTVNGAGVSHIEEETPEPATAQEIHSTVATECPRLLTEIRKLLEKAIRETRTRSAKAKQEIEAKTGELKAIKSRISNQLKDAAMEERQRLRICEQWDNARKMLEIELEDRQQELERFADKKTELSRLDTELKQLQVMEQKQATILSEHALNLSDRALEHLAKLSGITEKCLGIDELINADAEKIAREIAKHTTEVAEFNKEDDKENNRFML
ncbi:unnamed protein product, partial [Mesorhabditis belari]|uniref:Kinetochore protein NDC80 n=1 Tax=Mesorhabditis belari TaxID=2138241 RepID=A0AAF3FK42_9BILA